jgi:hypothetical protein
VGPVGLGGGPDGLVVEGIGGIILSALSFGANIKELLQLLA